MALPKYTEPHYRKRFLAAGVAIPPYSGTTKIKPSDLLQFSFLWLKQV